MSFGTPIGSARMPGATSDAPPEPPAEMMPTISAWRRSQLTKASAIAVTEAPRSKPNTAAPPRGWLSAISWAETSQVTALEIAQRFEDAGVAAIIFTDIARDGLLKGLNLDATIELAEAISIPVIASGGFASIEDVKALLAPRAKKLAGAIAGRALYDGRLDAAAALKLIRDAKAAA